MKSSSSDLSDRDTAAAVEELSGRIIGELHLEDGNEGGDIDWERTAGLAQRCADSLRSGPARTMWAQGQLIPVCGQLLQIGLGTPAALPCMTQCCRVIGNIVLDHPANRTKCRVADVPQRVYRFLQAVLAAAPPCSLASDQVLALKAATGALLNLTIDTPDIRRILLDAKAADGISGMLSVHRVGVWPMQTDTLARATIAEWATKLLQELLAGEERLSTTVAKNLSGAILALPLPGTPEFDRSSGLSASLPADATRTLLAADLSIMRAATEILESIAYKDEAFQELLAFPPSSSSATADQSLLDQMLDFVEHADLLPAWLPLAQEDAERAAAKGQQMQSRRQEDEEDDDEGEVLDVEKSVSTVKAEVARIVIAVSSNDRVMHAAFEAVSGARTGASALLPRCTAWIRSGRTDLIITGSTMLANLARKESYCVQLAHDHALAEPLAVLLQAYSASPPPPTTRPGEATQVLHGITGLIKNLAIPGANKQLLSDAGVIEPCLALLRPTLDMVVPLQNASIGILKHLCAGNVASALKVVLPAVAPGQTNVISLSPANANANGGAASGNGPLDVVLDLIARTSDVRLKSEATRLLVNVIRSLYSARSIASPVTPSALGGLETGIAKSRARAILEKSDKMAEAISEMLRTGEKYPVLVNEAIVALTLLSTTEPGATVTLQAVTTVHETLHSPPPMTGAAGLPAAAGDPSSPAQPGGRPRPLPRRTNGFTSNTQLSPSTPNSRAPSLMTRSAPPSALDILIRWLTEYSITAANMPAELAGNALALLEGMIRSPPLAQEDNAAARKRLRLNECKAVVRGVVGRKPELPAEEALQHAAKRALGVLEALA